MNIEDAVHDDRVTGETAAEKRASLLAAVSGSGDSTAYTWSGFGQRLLLLGVDSATVMALPTMIPTLTGGTLFDKCLTSGGFDFSDATNRALMTAAKQGASEAVVSLLDAMLAIGANQPLWRVMGVASEPTIEQVEAAIAEPTEAACIAHFVNEKFTPAVQRGDSIEQLLAIVADTDNWDPRLS